jgi:hypothetical protein
MILYGIFLSGDIETSVYYEDGFAVNSTIIFSIIVLVLFNLFYALLYSRSMDDERRAVVTASRETGFSLMKFFRKYIKEIGIYSGIYAVTQLGFCGFYAFFGFDFEYTTFYEQLHVADAGFYLLTKNALLGLILSSLLMGILLGACRLLVLTLWRLDKNNSVK